MRIDVPDHPLEPWQLTPLWMFWRPRWRQRHWRWIVDYNGCYCEFYWQYRRGYA